MCSLSLKSEKDPESQKKSENLLFKENVYLPSSRNV